MISQNKPYLIAETAFHHEGDTIFLHDLIDEILKTKADAIKFHLLFDLNDYMISNHEAIGTLKNLLIEQKEWDTILKKLKNSGKDIIFLCNDVESLKWVNKIQYDNPIAGIELHATGLNDVFLMQEALKFEKTIILGTGGSTFDEIKYALDFFNQNGKEDLLLMHGFQNYPTNYEEINFKRMQFLQQAFDLPVGYADHTDPADENNAIISTLPQILGFSILEKHITHKFGEKRIDAQAAVSINMFNKIAELAEIISKTAGKQVFILSDSEKKYGNTGPMKKAIVARKKIKKGEKISLDNIAFKRTNLSSPLQQQDLQKILNQETIRDIEKDEIVTFKELEYEFKENKFSQFFISKKDGN